MSEKILSVQNLVINFKTDGGILQYLHGKSFQVEQVDFAEEYFPK